MEDPDFENAKQLKLVLEKAQVEMENLFRTNEFLQALEESRVPTTKKILQILIESSKETTINDILSVIKANDNLFSAIYSTSYEGYFQLLLSLIKCIKDMTILIGDKFTPLSIDYLNESFNFWKNLRI